MRINFFCPLPPAPTEFAQHLLRILPDLAAACDLTLWTSAPDWDKSLTRHAPVIAYNPATIATDPRARSGHNVYNIGNGNGIDLDGDIWEASRAISGILILHDASLFEFVAGYFRRRHPSRDRLIEALRAQDGEAAVLDYEAYERGAVTRDEMCLKYPLTKFICANATAVLLHSEAVRATLSLPAHIPVAVANLPSAARAAGSPGRARLVDAHTASGYVAGLLALCAEVREETAPASRHLLDRVGREQVFLGPAARNPGFLVGLGDSIADITPGQY